MPDRRRHRGKHPQDDELFAGDQHERLRQAVADFSWLLTRGYATDSALKLVGDRFDLTARQRLAVQRCSCADAALCSRRAKEQSMSMAAAQRLGIDGYNLLITVESALSGALLLLGRDGCVRDLASIHGTYRHVEETIPALNLIMDYVDDLRPSGVDWYLDRPVSNSGRLKALMAEVLERRTPLRGSVEQEPGCNGQGWAGMPGDVPAESVPWNIELVDSPDRTLISYPGIVVSSDSVVLDGCERWMNLARGLITRLVPGVWLVDLGDG